MSKLMIIGSGHVGAYKNAAQAFGELYPDIDVQFFAMHDPLFLSGSIDKAGVFTPRFRTDKDRAFVQEINGSELVDVNGADHLLLVGHRFAFNNLVTLLEDHDILERVRTGKPKLISESLVRDIINSVATASVAETLGLIEAYDRAVTFAMAPYPASNIVAETNKDEMARLLELFWARPDAAWFFEYWLSEVQNALKTKGHDLLIQPDILNAGPFATKPEYAASIDNDAPANTDHRHMNADFGLAMLRRYTEKHLGLSPQGYATLNERIA